jgi:hypothetical protein
MSETRPLARHLARYSAGVLALAGVGAVAAVGVWQGISPERLWVSIVWGGTAALILGWAAGHAAGRLFFDVREQARSSAQPAEGSTEETTH